MKTPRPLVPVGAHPTRNPAYAEVCAAAGHPQQFINVSKSTDTRTVTRCLCGEVEKTEDQQVRG